MQIDPMQSVLAQMRSLTAHHADPEFSQIFNRVNAAFQFRPDVNPGRTRQYGPDPDELILSRGLAGSGIQHGIGGAAHCSVGTLPRHKID